MHTELEIRRSTIRKLAACLSANQPLQPHYLQHLVWINAGLVASEATIRRDIRAIVDAMPERFSVRRGALIRNA